MLQYEREYPSPAADSATPVIPLSEIPAVKAFIDLVCRSDDGTLAVIGWLYDPENQVRGFSLFSEGGDLFLPFSADGASFPAGARIERVRRPDVAHALAIPEGEYGFVLVFPEFPPDGGIALALGDGRRSVLPFVALEERGEIRQAVRKYRQHSGAALLAALRAGLGDDHPLTGLAAFREEGEEPDLDRSLLAFAEEKTPRTQFHIECGMRLKTGVILVGWAAARDGKELRIELSGEGGRGKKIPLAGGEDGRILVRTFRPDLREVLPAPVFHRGMHGFVFFYPLAVEPPATLKVNFAGSRKAQEVPLPPGEKALPALTRVWLHAGAALHAIAAQLGEKAGLADLLEEVEAARICESGAGFASCDQALLLNSRALILNGWIAATADEIEGVELTTEQGRFDITGRIRRYVRPDLHAAFPWSAGEALGFLCILTEAGALTGEARLKIVCRDGRIQILRPEVWVMDWGLLGNFLNQHPFVGEPLVRMLAATSGIEKDSLRLGERLAWLRRGSFLSRHPHLAGMVEHPETVTAAIDRAYPLGDAGVLIFGWRLTPKRRPASVTVRTPEGEAVEVSGKMFPLLRLDVAQMYRSRFPEVDEWCGFACLAPLPTRVGEPRALCFDFGELGEVWLKVPTDRPQVGGLELIRELLGMIPAPERMRHALYDLFGSGLGAAIETVSRSRPPFGGTIEERQFGTAGEAAVSVIVPLYGRFDFLRHQLAQFADDPDFQGVDLIYVVDDPSILAATLELAAKYHPLFEVPFRVVWYGQNRGFAGANNLGARVARGECLLLMNSDVLPQRPGWLGTLREALETLPGAGAVGPLLQFGDGSIQHAGMYPRRDPLLPGFLLNTHPRMGMAWAGGEEASEPPMLTAACLMLRKGDYEAAGGLDEGYLVGDFEDSDLCLALRKAGKRLWLVPAAKLWHLERQSQDIRGAVGQRQLLTLFNGWRYHEKIRAGRLADPTGKEV